MSGLTPEHGSQRMKTTTSISEANTPERGASLKEMTETQREAFEERAAILEFDAHLPREVAEARAMEETLKRNDQA